MAIYKSNYMHTFKNQRLLVKHDKYMWLKINDLLKISLSLSLSLILCSYEIKKNSIRSKTLNNFHSLF
jgi:hypothetical protein